MLASGPPYRDFAATKRAYRSGRFDAALYDDIIWVLKTQRNNRIDAEKLNYRRRIITRDEYARRVRKIELDYAGE
jgi:hypothetical protein